MIDGAIDFSIYVVAPLMSKNITWIYTVIEV